MQNLRWSTVILLVLGACGAPEDSVGPELFGTTYSAIAPAGSGATIAANTFPTVLVPGERVPVLVTMTNAGAASPANDWDNEYLFLQQTGSTWGAPSRLVSGTVTPGNTFDFYFPITAPTSGGPFTFQATMYSLVTGLNGAFGDQVETLNITLDSNRRPFYGCALDSSTIPGTMEPGEEVDVTVTLINTGTEDWLINQFCMYSRDTPFTEFGSSTCIFNDATVAGSVQGTPLGTGNTHTFSLRIRAPAAAGSYTFSRQILDTRASTAGGIGFFDNTNNCVDIPVTVGSASFDATWDQANSTVPTTMLPSEVREITVRMENTGSATWPSSTPGNVLLATENSPRSLWENIQYHPIPSDTTAGNSVDYVFTITAPATPGTYTFQYRLFYDVPGEGFFGDTVNQSIVVDAAATPAFDSEVVTEDYDILQIVRNGDLRITMRNTGSDTWQPGIVSLVTQNTPPSLYNVAFADLTQTVAPNETFTFDFSVLGPTSPGTYDSFWQLEHSGSGLFGETTSGNVLVIDTCGNNSIDATEQCDDGNNFSGDGCSAACLYERVDIDLASTPVAEHSFVGPLETRNVEKVAIGDINNDGTPDVAIGALGVGSPNRFRAGAIFVFTGGAGFFDSATQTATIGAYLQIAGARNDDELTGSIYGRLLVDDVTGDGIDDIIASAPEAACADNTGTCGRVYVIAGGSSLNSVTDGIIDLNAPTADVVATLVAPNETDNPSVLAIGEVTGDGFNDILIGLPGGDGSIGSVVVVEGGPTLSDLTLSPANVFATLNGVGADDQLGVRGSIGDISGDGQSDIMVSSTRHDPTGGGSDAGGLWAVFGPVTSGATINLASTFSARWFGPGIRDHLGSSFVAADLTGDSNNDVVIGVDGARFGGVRYGSVDVWTGPISDGSTFDLSAAATPDLRIQGTDAADGFGWNIQAGEISNINRGDKQDLLLTTYLPAGVSGTLTQAGESVLLLGSSTATDFQVSISDDTVMSLFGSAFTSRMGFYPSSTVLGDIDNDGELDICVGSLNASGGAGRVDCVRNRW